MGQHSVTPSCSHLRKVVDLSGWVHYYQWVLELLMMTHTSSQYEQIGRSSMGCYWPNNYHNGRTNGFWPNNYHTSWYVVVLTTGHIRWYNNYHTSSQYVVIISCIVVGDPNLINHKPTSYPARLVGQALDPTRSRNHPYNHPYNHQLTTNQTNCY